MTGPKMVSFTLSRYPVLEKINRWLDLYPDASCRPTKIRVTGGGKKTLYKLTVPEGAWTDEVEAWVYSTDMNAELVTKEHGVISVLT